MREPIILHCQCGDPGCHNWVRLRDDDAALVGPGRSILHPGHVHPRDRLREVRAGYVIVDPDKVAV
jgi:hypothetical protein